MKPTPPGYLKDDIQFINYEFMEKTLPQEKFHLKMLQQYKNYHQTARNNQNYSLLQSLQVFSKFVQNDQWLNIVVNEEISMLEKNECKNPYWKKFALK